MGMLVRMMEIIFFAFLTGYLAFRLWSILGKRTGFDGTPPEHQSFIADDMMGNVIPLPERKSLLKEEKEEGETFDSALDESIQKIKAVDPDFNMNHFLRGAKAAFRMVVEAYAKADQATLKSLLNSSVLKSFMEAIQERQEANQSLEIQIVEVKEPQIISAEIKGKQAQITLKFSSEQITVTKDEAGNILDNPARLSLTLKDIWTFSRTLGSKNPNWLLIATHIEGN
jgi:predicted lipid-binding transport protein (Tim44 family)